MGVKPFRIFISTGEVSGDLQGSMLVAALKRRAEWVGQEIEIVALGGQRMAQAGATLLGDTTAIGSVGIIESLPFVLPTLRMQRRVKQILQDHPPDLVVLIDYLGPNIGMGTFVRENLPHIPIVYYIAPQEWVWSLGQRNTRQLVGITDRLLAIFPEEARYYQSSGANVTWIGHPLIDRVSTFPTREAARATLGISDEQVAIALIPASRRQEVKHLLPVIIEAARHIQAQLHQVHFWIPLSLEVYRQPIERAIAQAGLKATLVTQHTQAVLAAADLAITKSGTVNLEIALMQVPQVVLYRVSALTAWVAQHLLKFSIPFMSPPNLALMEPIVPEFLQDQATPDNIANAALGLLLDPTARAKMLSGYERMRQTLGEPGVCDRAAAEIFNLIPPTTPS